MAVFLILGAFKKKIKIKEKQSCYHLNAPISCLTKKIVIKNKNIELLLHCAEVWGICIYSYLLVDILKYYFKKYFLKIIYNIILSK